MSFSTFALTFATGLLVCSSSAAAAASTASDVSDMDLKKRPIKESYSRQRRKKRGKARTVSSRRGLCCEAGNGEDVTGLVKVKKCLSTLRFQLHCHCSGYLSTRPFPNCLAHLFLGTAPGTRALCLRRRSLFMRIPPFFRSSARWRRISHGTVLRSTRSERPPALSFLAHYQQIQGCASVSCCS